VPCLYKVSAEEVFFFGGFSFSGCYGSGSDSDSDSDSAGSDSGFDSGSADSDSYSDYSYLFLHNFVHLRTSANVVCTIS